MNYDDHIRRHRAAQAARQAESSTAADRRRIALEEGHREGETILRDTITPELAKLQTALAKSGHRAKVTTTRQVSPADPAAEFDIAVELVGEAPPAALRYTAIPAGKYFVVSITDGLAPGPRLEVRFGDVTPAQVQDACAAFLSLAFPA